MTFKHKLSRRLAVLPLSLTALVFAGCDAGPTEVTELVPYEAASALPTSTADGTKVVIVTRAKVYASASTRSAVTGSQWPGAVGTILEGPTAITSREPYALWRVSFPTHPFNGWVRGDQLALVAAPAPVVTTVTISPSAITVDTGATSQLTVTVRDAQGATMTGQAIAFASANSAIATVSSTGLVRGVAAGTVVVTASTAGVHGATTVTVRAPAPAPTPVVTSVTVSPTSFALDTGATRQLSVTLRDANGNTMTGPTITYASLNSGVATVSATGLVRGVAAGVVLVSATSNGISATATVTVNAPAPPPPPPPPPADTTGARQIIYSSDWSTSMGLASSTLTDGSRWSMLGGQGLEVISGSGLGFPTTNVLRVTALQATTGYAFLRKTGMPVPAVGESNYYRWYFRATMPDGLEDAESHPFQDGNASSQSNWLFHVWHNQGGNGSWTPEFRASGAENGTNARWYGPALRKGQTYRFELRLERTGVNSMRFHPRIYDAAGTLIATTETFRDWQGQARLAGTTLILPRPAELGGLNAGNNGIAGTPTWPFVYGYQAAVAVCRVNWCGPYVAGEGR